MLPRDGLYVYAYRELLVCLKGYAKGGERAPREEEAATRDGSSHKTIED
jgi:hypothetical protein